MAGRRGLQPNDALALAAPLLGALALALALAGCDSPTDNSPAMVLDQACATAADCEDSPVLADQVRRDTEAMLAGMAHARARLGLVEDAAP